MLFQSNCFHLSQGFTPLSHCLVGSCWFKALSFLFFAYCSAAAVFQSFLAMFVLCLWWMILPRFRGMGMGWGNRWNEKDSPSGQHEGNHPFHESCKISHHFPSSWHMLTRYQHNPIPFPCPLSHDHGPMTIVPLQAGIADDETFEASRCGCGFFGYTKCPSSVSEVRKLQFH